MKQWKLVGALALAVAVLGLACGDDGAAPEEGTPAEATPAEATPAEGTPTDATPADSGSSPIVLPTPVACVPVDPAPSISTIPLAEMMPAGKIAFVSFRDEYEGRPNREIYVISPDSDGPVNLTLNSCADDEPDWSPDGSMIAWESNRDGNYEIYVMKADGGDVAQLTTDGGLAPRWSPDGQKIAYTRGGTIYVMNADGSDAVVVLTADPKATEEELCRSGGFPGGWSPDGSRVVYYSASLAGGVALICTVTVDGSEVDVLVSEPPVYNVEPVLSPDGTLVAFRSIRDGNSDVYVINLEDGSEQRLTDFDGLDIEPDWSPDGEWIVFGSNRDGIATDIYVMRADGSDVRRLTEHVAKDSYPVWSP